MLREHKIRVGVVKLGFSREVTFELTFSGYIKKCAQGHNTFLLPEKYLIKHVSTSSSMYVPQLRVQRSKKKFPLAMGLKQKTTLKPLAEGGREFPVPQD